jgi:hypothetical protein
VQIAACAVLDSIRGLVRGRLVRSAHQAADARADASAASQRCHQRCAVAGATPKRAAAVLNDAPLSIARTTAHRPAGPSLALG